MPRFPRVRALLRRSFVLWCMIASVSLTTTPAACEERASELAFSVATPMCESSSMSVDALLELLRIEMVNQGLDVGAEGAAGARARLQVRLLDCESRQIELQLTDARGRRVEQLDVDASGVDAATKPRMLALAVAEFVRNTRVLAPVAAPPPTVESPASSPTASVQTPPLPLATTPSRNHGSMGAHVRTYPNLSAGMVGPWLEVSRALWHHAELAGGALLAFGGATDPLGEVQFGLAVLRGSARLVAQVAPRLLVTAGPTAEFGVGWARGRGAGAEIVASGGSSPMFALGFESTLRARVFRSWWLSASVQGGGTIVGFHGRAGARNVGGAEGPWLGLGSGFGASW